MTRWMLAWAMSLLVASACQGQATSTDAAAREVEEDNSLTTSLVTPHKAWGKGYAGGPVRALFLVYHGPYDGSWSDPGTRMREVVELCERFDLQADAAFFGGSGNGPWEFHGQKLGEERAERLLAKPYQLYVIAGFPMEKLPAKMQYLILEQVVKGAGLLYVNGAPCEYLAPKRLVDPVPAALTQGVPMLGGKTAAETMSAYRLKAGRGVWLKYGAYTLTPGQEFTRRGLAEYDYWMLLVGRAALWAASREGEVEVTVLGDKPLRLNRANAAGAEVALTSTAQQPVEALVGLELRRAADGAKTRLAGASVTLAPGQTARVPVTLPRLRAGDYFVDVMVARRDAAGLPTDLGRPFPVVARVVAFGAGTLTVESDFGINEVTVNPGFVERGGSVSGKVSLRGTPPAKSVLRLRFCDSYDRVLNRQDLQVNPGQADYAFEYRTDPFATIVMRVEAALIVAGEEVEMKEASFTVPKRRQGQFNFVIWDAPRDVLGYYAWRKLQEVGMNTCLIGSFGPSAQPPVLRACDASLIPYSTRIMDEKDENGYMKPVCWNDEPAVTKYVQGIVDNQKQLREQGVFTYSLGDEGVTLGCCVHPACLAAYRQYLNAQYGAIEQLNAEWGTNYKSFDDVDLLDHKDNMEEAASKTCFPRWYDRQAFARMNLAQFSHRFGVAYRALDPESHCGFEGTGGFGDDYDAILGANTFYGPYPSIGDDIIRGAAPRELIRSNWMGYSKTGDALSDAAWRMVMKGMDSVWYWMWAGCGSWRGYLSPTLDFWNCTADVAEEMKPVRQGLGDLLLKSKMTHSGIAIFYSVPSALSNHLEPGSGFIAADTTHETWTRLTYDLGLDFRYLTSQMLKSGALDVREFKVLLLPMAQAIGPEEAAAIRRFAQAGGTVIADVRPGIYDGHCKPMTPGVLDDLFGIQRTGRGKASDKPLAVKVHLEGRDLDLNIPQVRLDTDVKPGSAAGLARVGETPVLFVNRVGQGRAILLNCQLLLPQPDDAQAAGVRRLVGALYTAAGLKLAIRSTAPDGGTLPLTETRIWQDGDAQVIGLWRMMQGAWFSPKSGTTAGAPVAVKLTLPSPRHVYDLRAHKYLGNVATVDTKLRWGRANFFLALPYQIKGVDLSLTPSAPAPGTVVTASIRLRVPANVAEKHAVWVEVIDPDGQRPLWGRQVVMLEHGAGKVQFPVAFNEKPGQWKIEATELFSNQSAEAAWTVK